MQILEEGLASCGYKIGLFTSPFITNFNERIRLGGQDISDEDLKMYGDKVLEAVEKMVADGNESPTEFEVVTAIALLYFANKSADIVILEVGLGGIGDSTNVIEKPMICAITSISYDHMDRLGNTLEEIAADKAGIIKEGVPVISNVSDHSAAAVIARTAYEKDSKLYDISKIKFGVSDESAFSQTVTMELYGTDYSDVKISMTGRHQGENLKTALTIIEVLRKAGEIKVERSRLYKGLAKAVQPGRFETILEPSLENNTPIVIVDGAHNEAGARALKETMQHLFKDKKILLVTGMLADKQIDEILGSFTNITADIIATEPDNPRRLSAQGLADKLKLMGYEPMTAADAQESVRLVKQMWHDYDAVLFAGSLYLIGDVRRILKNEQ